MKTLRTCRITLTWPFSASSNTRCSSVWVMLHFFWFETNHNTAINWGRVCLGFDTLSSREVRGGFRWGHIPSHHLGSALNPTPPLPMKTKMKGTLLQKPHSRAPPSGVQSFNHCDLRMSVNSLLTRAARYIACDSHAHLVSKDGSVISRLCIKCRSIWKQLMEIYG